MAEARNEARNEATNEVRKPEYIEREALMEQVKAIHRAVNIADRNISYDTGFHSATSQIQGLIAWIPAADVVEVRRGKWIFLCAVSTMQYEAYEYRCSLCNEVEEMYKKKPFCPNCGADMRGDKR